MISFYSEATKLEESLKDSFVHAVGGQRQTQANTGCLSSLRDALGFAACDSGLHQVLYMRSSVVVITDAL